MGRIVCKPRGVPFCGMAFASIESVLEDLRLGRIIVLVDDEQRENEGDFVCAAESISVETLNFMTRVGGGYLCVALDGEACDRLDLVPQTGANTSLRSTAFTVSVDGHPRHGVGTGISARDRVASIRLLAAQGSTSDDFVRPGHINPLRSREGGVLVRTGQTEGSVDLCRLAGLRPAACIIEIVRSDGEMARRPDLERLCAEHNIKMCSVEQLIEHRLRSERLVQRIEPVGGEVVYTPEGSFTVYAWKSSIDPLPHLALCMGGVGSLDAAGQPLEWDEPTLVRVQRRNLLGDIFGVAEQPVAAAVESEASGQAKIRASLRQIAAVGRGALVYVRPEWNREGLFGQIHRVHSSATTRSDSAAGDDAEFRIAAERVHPHAEREIGIGGQILRDLGLRRIIVLSDHQMALPALHGFGLEVVDTVPLNAVVEAR